MYDINDKKAAVRNVQSMLSELGYYRSFINGFYDVNTSGAVKRFQKEEGLDANGIVNAETLSLLHKRNSAIRVGIKNTFPITKETNSTTVREINALMREVLEYYFGAYDLD
ncbi:MAG: peptidoglycan-binding protein, partial [Clostridia bacterium]|nr:peptidoglycan-binding protein [Clostridia bacterium]